MTLILDAGALVALERNDRVMWRRLKAAVRSGSPPATHGGVIAQVWRGGAGRQARLAASLGAVDVRPLDDHLGRAAGLLLGRAGLSDAVDAAVAALAASGDVVLTSDPDDLAALVEASGALADVIAV
jgi:hypothetical protein